MTMTLDGQLEAAEPLVRDGLKYPFPARPEPGAAIKVAPGILWVRMPLPFQLNHINVWMIEDGEGWAIVDTGVNGNTTRKLWEQVITEHGGGKPITRVIVTHLHPDHVGAAGWLVEKYGVQLYMSRTDYLLCRTLVMDTGLEAPEEGMLFYKAAGFDDEMLAVYKKRFGGFGSGVYRLPQSFRRLQEGEELMIGGRWWRIVVGRGHAPEHACLYCPELKVFIAGDQILPRITSNVSVFPTEPDADPLDEWITSCHQLREMIPEETLILPAHNEPFYGAHIRLTQLIDGHEESLQKLLDLCAEPKRAVDCFPALFRARITAGNYGMATGESIAHLNCLIARGKIKRTRDKDGVDWYQKV